MFLALWLALSAQAGCDNILDLLLTHAERSFVSGDVQGVEGAAIDARNSVDCVGDSIDNHTAARIHRAEALATHLRGNTSRTDALLAAMVHADPWLGVADLVDHGHPLAVRLVYVEERGASDTRTLMWPESGFVHVDGIPSAIAPTGQPWVYQQVKDDGDVIRSRWVDIGGTPPTLIGSVGDKARVKNGWKLTGATLALVGGGLGIGQAHPLRPPAEAGLQLAPRAGLEQVASRVAVHKGVPNSRCGGDGVLGCRGLDRLIG